MKKAVNMKYSVKMLEISINMTPRDSRLVTSRSNVSMELSTVLVVWVNHVIG